MAKACSEIAVFEFLKKMGLPGIRLGEGDPLVGQYLSERGYNFTPDLVAGPDDLNLAPVEGLFFVDVLSPTSDLLFKASASHQLPINVSRTFKALLDNAKHCQEKPSIAELPTEHHQCYLGALNKKLEKYSHKRPFTRDGKNVVTANLGIVHHFNLGMVKETNVANVRDLITLLDYVRFYKSLATSSNIDLSVAENRLLQELVNHQQQSPCVMVAFREWPDVPHLFLMIHVVAEKSIGTVDLSIILLNSSILGTTHPVHQWFNSMIKRNPPEVVTDKDPSLQGVVIEFNKDGSIFN